MKVASAPERRRDDLSDPATFARIHREHGPSVLRAARAIVKDAGVAQDISQEVFLRLWREPALFNPRRGSLPSYLNLMARSRALDFWRTQQAARRARERLAAEPATARRARGPANDELAQAAADRSILLSALEALPLEQREAIFLTYWGGMTATDVARSCNVPRGTAKSRVRLGVAKLRHEAFAAG